MHPVLVQIGGISLYSWGFMLAIAVIISTVGVRYYFVQEGLNPNIVLDIVLITVICGIIGARIAYILLYEWSAFLTDPWAVLTPFSGGISGMVWYGGLIAGFVAFAVILWLRDLPFWRVLDIFAPFVALSYAIARIGCFLSGCCYGKPTQSVLGVVFPYVDSLSRHPTQLYGTAVNLILFLFLVWFYPRRHFSGQIVILYLIGYAVYRFILEFFRVNIIMYGPLSIGQVYSLLLLLVALWLYYWRNRQQRKFWF